MSEKSTRNIEPNIVYSPIETLQERTRSGRVGGTPQKLTFQFRRLLRVEGFDFLDCDAGVRVNSVRHLRDRMVSDGTLTEADILMFEPISLCALDSRIYGPWKMPVFSPGEILEIELDGKGRYGFILRTTEVE